MKTKRYIARENEMAFAAGLFNLSGEVAVCESPVKPPTIAKPVSQDWFVDHAAVESARAIIAGELRMEA